MSAQGKTCNECAFENLTLHRLMKRLTTLIQLTAQTQGAETYQATSNYSQYYERENSEQGMMQAFVAKIICF